MNHIQTNMKMTGDDGFLIPLNATHHLMGGNNTHNLPLSFAGCEINRDDNNINSTSSNSSNAQTTTSLVADGGILVNYGILPPNSQQLHVHVLGEQQPNIMEGRSDATTAVEIVVGTIIDNNMNSNTAKRPLDGDEETNYYNVTTATESIAGAVKRQKVGPDMTAAQRQQHKKQINNEQWDLMYQRLLQYRERFGNCLVPKRWKEDPQLGTWVETQRVQYKKLSNGVDGVPLNKRLGPERLAKLEAIGFAWSAKIVKKANSPTTVGGATSSSAGGTVVDAAAGALADNSTINIRTATPPLNTMNTGVATMTDSNNNNSSTPKVVATENGKPARKRPSLTAEDAQTKAAGRTRLYDEQWEDFFRRLQAYKEKHGDCLVPRKYEADPKLATWVDTQRALFNRDFKQQGQQQERQGETSEIANSGEAGEPPVAELPVESAAATPMIVDNQEDSTASSTSQVLSVETTAAPATDDSIKMSSAENSNTGGATAAATESLLMDTATGKLPARRLTQERKDRLDALGFVWSLRHKRIEDHWDSMFRQLVEYKNKHGDCLVPSRFEENNKLGKWVETQRYEYTKLQRAKETQNKASGSDEGEGTGNAVTTGQASESGSVTAPSPTSSANKTSRPRLTEDRIRRLESIGFEWKVKHKMKRYYDRQWDAMLERLLEFKEREGHVLVPKRYPPDLKLGQWVHTQRIQYRKLMAGTGKKGGDASEFVASGEIKKEEEVSYRLTEERRKRLEDSGFVWSAKEGEKNLGETGKVTRNSYDNQWDAMFQRLVRFKEANGHCLVPKRYSADPQLGTWCDTQRVQRKKLEKKLAELSLSPNKPSADGQAEESNEASSSKPIVGRLTEERIRRLESIGFTWSLRDDWQKHYEELRDFVKLNGHANVPARFTQNRRLGIWVSAQRQQYKIRNAPQDASKPKKSTPLTDGRIKLLNDLGFTWAVRSRENPGDSWRARFETLKRFKAEYGHIPSSASENPELAMFVREQRNQYKLYVGANRAGEDPSTVSEMTEERIRLLEEVGFVWESPDDENEANSEGYERDRFEKTRLTELTNAAAFATTANDASILQEALQRAEEL